MLKDRYLKKVVLSDLSEGVVFVILAWHFSADRFLSGLM